MAARRPLEPSGQGSSPCPPAPEDIDKGNGGPMGQGLTVVVLAAGEGKRFRSALPKPLHPVAGRPLLWHVLAAAAPLKADRTVVVVGNGADQVTAAVDGFDLGPVAFAVQADQRGTGDALAAALPLLEGDGDVMVLSGDTPLVSAALLEGLLDAHRSARAAATLLTCHPGRPDRLRPGAARRRRRRHRDGRGARRHPRPARGSARSAPACTCSAARPSTAWPSCAPTTTRASTTCPTWCRWCWPAAAGWPPPRGRRRRSGGSTTGSSWPRPGRCCAGGCWSG